MVGSVLPSCPGGVSLRILSVVCPCPPDSLIMIICDFTPKDLREKIRWGWWNFNSALATVSKVHYLVFQVDVGIFWQSTEGCTAVQDPRWPPSAPLEADHTPPSWNTMSKLIGANFVEPSKYFSTVLTICFLSFSIGGIVFIDKIQMIPWSSVNSVTK